MWVENHAHRVLALNIPDRQAWVVGGDGAGPDDHGVDERSQSVQPADVGRSGDIVGMAVLGGDPVEDQPAAERTEASETPLRNASTAQPRRHA